MRAGLIGVGNFGKNILRNLFKFKSEIEDIVVCDTDASKVANLNLPFCCNPEQIFNNPKIDTVFIVTPAETHFDLVKKALNAGKNVYVEKPLTFYFKEAEELCKLADEKNLILHVDLTFLYDSSIIFLRDLVQYGALGEIQQFETRRENFGPFLNKVGVIKDLVTHDLSIIEFVLGFFSPTEMAIKAICEESIEDVLILINNQGIYTKIKAGWLNDEKIREIKIVGSKKIVILRNNDAPAIIDIEKKEITKVEFTKLGESLEVEMRHFLDCIKNKRKTLSDGWKAANLVKRIEEIEKEIK